jgi:hypothetical protein
MQASYLEDACARLKEGLPKHRGAAAVTHNLLLVARCRTQLLAIDTGCHGVCIAAGLPAAWRGALLENLEEVLLSCRLAFAVPTPKRCRTACQVAT